MNTVLREQLPTMLTLFEVIEATGLSEYCVRKLVKENKVVHIKIGNKSLINFESLVAYLNTGETI